MSNIAAAMATADRRKLMKKVSFPVHVLLVSEGHFSG